MRWEAQKMNFEQLEGLLQQTRNALLEGDLTALDVLAMETEAALENTGALDEKGLDRVRLLAGENATLIEAALRGVAAAKERLSRPEAFSTYDSQGQRGLISSADPGKPRRI
ncbi:flagellar biosynthesis protein FlgN [Xinfangfangia sp. D13-10-4-6]|uniref:flagellar biosynthesis protein FlgN n=1 Tax=Pseudogemmobacter hezensis TaxID=2737662 RepID=UPI001554E6BC|nr:flagellar biosynthesis protein FlgN [Pseudogemmobacter hezensis]NPD17516.1 flagellar biosynthesis protein FlgN [Pseudogemmobacter hezensis]